MFIFGARNFHSAQAQNKKNCQQKMESIYGAGFWSVCLRPKMFVCVLHFFLTDFSFPYRLSYEECGYFLKCS